MNAIEMHDVSLTVNDFSIHPVRLDIPKGSIIACIGRNGAGKTTLFQLLHGVYSQFNGHLSIGGMSYPTDERTIRESMAVMYDSAYLNPNLKPWKLKALEEALIPTFDAALFNALSDALGLDLEKRIRNQSLGMKRKLDFALALARNPQLLLLDEPFNGIDPVAKKTLIHWIQAYMEDESHTVIISSHQVDDLEKIADYIMIIDHGKIVVFEDKETLLESYGYLTDETQAGPHTITEIPADFKGTKRPASLEDIFIHLVGDAA